MVLEAEAQCLSRNDWSDTLYRKLSQHKSKKIDIRFIPYYAWGNRGDSTMMVWLPLR